MVDKTLIPPSHLPEKQRVFYVRYLQTLNAYQAAIDAGYAETTAQKKAYRWVGKSREACSKSYRKLWDAIQEALKNQIEEIALSKGWLLEKLMEIAGFSLQDIIDPETGRYLPLHKLPPEAAAGIESMSMTQEKNEEGGERLVMDVKTIRAGDRIKAIGLISRLMQYDPSVEYKSNAGPGSGDNQKTVIKNIMSQVAGKTRGLPKPVYEMNDSFGVEDE